MDVGGFRGAGLPAALNFSLSSHDMIRVSFLFGAASPASTAWVANLAVYVPFVLEAAATVRETFVDTGTLTTSNAMEIGVYTLAGTRLFTSTLTVASASTTVNSSGTTDYRLDAGSYYMALAGDGTRNILSSVIGAGLAQSVGIVEQTGLTGANLPSTATFAAYARTFVPSFGLNLHGTAF